ncbi:MAG TPA: hypothetical protein VFE62_19120 [Gemmataceae bacterium]|nr:hypothetical protein [Gemmataceae bacterium]
MTQLRVLDLRRTKISDAGIVSLAKLNHLEELFLGDTEITLGGIERLGKQLPKVKLTDR